MKFHPTGVRVINVPAVTHDCVWIVQAKLISFCLAYTCLKVVSIADIPTFLEFWGKF
jgi:hypothetical protein